MNYLPDLPIICLNKDDASSSILPIYLVLGVRLGAVGGTFLGSFELIDQLDAFQDFCGVEVRVDDFQKEHAIAKHELDVVGTPFLQLLGQVLNLVVGPTNQGAFCIDG